MDIYIEQYTKTITMEKLSKILHNLDQGNINIETAKHQVLDVTEAGKWTKQKPLIGVTHLEDFILLTAKWWGDGWNYDAFEIVYDDGYWKCLDLDGHEIGDIGDLKADYYVTIPQLKM